MKSLCEKQVYYCCVCVDCVLYRYEWVDVGMLDYDPDSKLYHVKRVYVPTKNNTYCIYS